MLVSGTSGLVICRESGTVDLQLQGTISSSRILVHDTRDYFGPAGSAQAPLRRSASP